jgi:hypothetical protein
MSQENFAKLLKAATEDETVMQKVRSANSFAALKSLAREQGCDLGDLSEEDAKLLMRVATGEVNQDTLSAQELAAIAGGIAIIGDPDGFKSKLGPIRNLSGTDLGSGR